MIKYAHRKNYPEAPINFKALEIDLRSNVFVGSDMDSQYYDLILHHDASAINFSYFDSLLKNCNSETELAINIKSAGLAKILFEQYKSKLDKLKSYFFFDMAIPDYLEFTKYFPHNTAKRVSEFEPYDNTGLMDWIWLDYFDIDNHVSEFYWELMQLSLKESKIVIVSPELHRSNFRLGLPELDEMGKVYGICLDV